MRHHAFTAHLRTSLALVGLLALARAQTPLTATPGDHAGDHFGASVALCDDLDGDGVADLLVGAPADPGTPSAPGYARVLSGADGSQIYRLLGPGGPDLFGFAVAAAGDKDGDGLRDLLVGNPGTGPQPGTEARLYSSATGQEIQTLVDGTGDTWAAFGHSVTDLGDLSGDGVPDFAVGAPSLSNEGPGIVHVYTGDGTLLFDLRGTDSGEQFGFAVAAGGDMDLDGTPDLIIGVPGVQLVRVVSGTGGAPIVDEPGAVSGFGTVISGAGDVDGDGVPDFALGLPSANRVDIISGADGALLRHFQKLAGEFGAALAPLGDVDDDGVPDLLVGAPGDDIVALVDAGAAIAISGESGQSLFKFAGSTAGGRLGAAVAAADVDGDGRLDPLVGATLEGSGAGVARLYSGTLPGSIKAYGIGCPGSFLITPRLDMFGDPLPGGGLTLSLTKGLGGAPALLCLGLNPAVAPLANGCILWMDPLAVGIGFVLDGGFPGAGTKVFSAHLPVDVPVGLSFAAQILIADEGTDGGLAGTSAFLVTVP